MKLAPFLVVTAVTEIAAGLCLLILPAVPLSLVLGIGTPANETQLMARWLGAALIAIGIACGVARNVTGNDAVRGLLTGILFYNVAAVAVLVLAGVGMNMTGPALWPVAALHSVLAVWGLWCLRAQVTP